MDFFGILHWPWTVHFFAIEISMNGSLVLANAVDHDAVFFWHFLGFLLAFLRVGWGGVGGAIL
jgi:hypothetical protein